MNPAYGLLPAPEGLPLGIFFTHRNFLQILQRKPGQSGGLALSPLPELVTGGSGTGGWRRRLRLLDIKPPALSNPMRMRFGA